MAPSDSAPVWFITGCSSGLGRELARLVIERGWRVVVTARHKERVTGLVEGAADRTLALSLDVTDAAQIATAVRAAQDRFGAVDVLVNNAGYGYQSSVEEGEEKQIRAQFDANVFGLFALTRAVLPGMRARRRGRIISITSVAGLIGFMGSGYYAASKHAVEGWTDALAAEVGPLGIRASCVEPGPFRTDWAGRSLKQTPSTISDYADTAAARLKQTAERSGTQAGDPLRAAAAMITLAEMPDPPRHLVLGEWGHDTVLARLKQRLAEIEGTRALSVGADYPKS